MNISGIRPTAGFYSYNSIKTNALHEEQNLEDSNAKENEKKEPGYGHKVAPIRS